MYENSTVENPTGEITPFFWHNKAYGSSKNYLIIRENNPNEFRRSVILGIIIIINSIWIKININRS
jgi:hypothetical protein